VVAHTVVVYVLWFVPSALAVAAGVALDRRALTPSPGPAGHPPPGLRPDAAPAPRRRRDAVRGRCRSALSAFARRTPLGAAAVVAAAGVAAIVPVFWLLGRGAKALEPVDRAVLGYFAAHQIPALNPLADLLTRTGNTLQTRIVVVTMAAVLLIAWRGPRRWLPPVVIAGTYLAEYVLQAVLARLVHRGHPPTTLGTWPSGGCARIVAVYGVCLFFLLLAVRASRRTAIVAGTVLALAEIAELFTRTYLLKHWLTDALGGALFGAALLLVAVFAARVALGRDPGR
jgi:hypothetical protein